MPICVKKQDEGGKVNRDPFRGLRAGPAGFSPDFFKDVPP